MFKARENGGGTVTIVNRSVQDSGLKREDVEIGPGVNTSDHPVSLVYANNENQYAVDISTPSPAEIIESDPIKSEGEVGSMEPIAENEYLEGIEMSKVGWQTPVSENNIAETSLNEVEDQSQNVSSPETDVTPSLVEIPVESATPTEQTPQPEEHEYGESENVLDYNEADDVVEPLYSDPDVAEVGDEGNIYHRYQAQSYQPVPEESEESEERSKDSEPQIDEYGNMLDEHGHPIIKHAFPDNWVLQPDEGDGIMRFETEDGQVRFIMTLDGDMINYPNPPNNMKLEMDTYHKHIPVTHRIASGCEFFVDTGEWRLQLESDIVNLLLRMDIAQDFEDITGKVLWNQNKDVTIENLTNALTIFKDCILDDSPVRWMLTKDSVYNPKSAVFRLASETRVENIIQGVTIHDGMSLVESKTSVSIPTQSDTEVRNVRNFMINEDSILEDQGIRHLDSEGCELAESVKNFKLTLEAKIEDQGTRHLLSEDLKLEDQGRRHLLCEEGDMEDIVREHNINEDMDLDDIKRGFDMCEDSDRLDIKRHYLTMDQSINRTPAIWNRTNFDGDLVDLKENRMEMDMKYEVSPSKFKLNQLDIDDDMLADIGDED